MDSKKEKSTNYDFVLSFSLLLLLINTLLHINVSIKSIECLRIVLHASI